MLVVVSAAQVVGILNDDVHGDEGTDAAQHGTQNQPQQDGCAVLLEVQAVPGGVGRQTVAQAVIPEEAVNSAGDKAEQDELGQTGSGLAVPRAHGVHIAGQGVQEVPAINPAGDEIEQNVGHQAAVGLEAVGGVAHGRGNGLAGGSLILGALLGPLGLLLLLGLLLGVPVGLGALGGLVGGLGEVIDGVAHLLGENVLVLAHQGVLTQQETQDGIHAGHGCGRAQNPQEEGAQGIGEAIGVEQGGEQCAAQPHCH